MATLTKPDFKLPVANPSDMYADQVWWFWHACKSHVGSDLRLGGIFANKKGFHQSGNANKARWPGNYSVREKINQTGLGMTKASAIDLTFSSAQSGNFKNIDLYSSRLLASMMDEKDPRTGLWLYEFYGQADNDRAVEGYNEYKEDEVSSDPSHLWHIHLSIVRSLLGNWWGAWAAYTVWIGWNTAKWRASLPTDAPKPPAPKPPAGTPNVPNHTLGAHEVKAGHRGTDVVYIQRFIGSAKMGAADGEAGPRFTSGVRWYQGMRKLPVDGIVGDRTWKAMGH